MADDSAGHDADSNLSQGSPTGDLPDILALDEMGDDLEWGLFIRNAYESSSVAELPVPVYLASFDDEEMAEIEAGINMANSSVGFTVFEVVDEWTPEARVIYRVSEVNFDESPEIASTADFDHVIGYTYNRNVYMDDKYDAGRIVTDWAMEIRKDSIDRNVVAHELGHAMGIQSHAKIDYENDTLVDLEDDSIMSATIPSDPTFSDYNTMMKKQGQLLLEYMDNN